METVVNAFLESIQVSESTRLAYANDLRVFIKFLCESQEELPSPNDLNTQRVAEFIKAQRQLGRRKNTLIRRLATLRYFRDYMVAEGLVPPNPFSVKDGEIQSVIEKTSDGHPIMCLDQEQIDSLLAFMDASPRPRALRDRAILMLILETGLPVGHLAALDMTDLDLSAGHFHIYLPDIGDRWLEMGTAVDAVRIYLEDGRPNLLHSPGEPALFISQMDGRLSRQGVWQILHYWGRKLEPPISLSPRLLSHTAVLRMSRAGFSTTEIQLRLGHRNPISTQALIRRLQNACVN